MMNESLEKLVKAGTLVCLVLALFILVLVMNGIKENKYIGGGVPGSNVISVSGEGEVTAVPDIAEITFEVVSEKPTVEAAQTAAADDMNAIIAFLKKEGIDEKDIKTTNYSANPRYEWRDTPAAMGVPAYGGGDTAVSYPYPGPSGDTRVLLGYEVRQSVSVKVRDTEKTGSILSGVGELGATNIYGPTFTIDNETELQREARQKAIDDAQTKAKQLASDLDVKLVRIVSFSESGGGYYPPMYRGLEAVAYDSSQTKTVPEIPTGENTINAYVTITYEIR